MLALATFVMSSCFVPMTYAADANVDCSDAVLRRFFPKEFVDQVLLKNGVPQDKLADINKDLEAADQQVLTTIEEKVKTLKPEDAQDANKRKEVVQFFRDTLTNSFGTVLKKYGITDDKKIVAILEEIQELKLKRYEACGGTVPGQPSPSNSNNAPQPAMQR